MMKRLVIAGSRDYAIEMAEAVWEINKIEPTWDVVGFLDDTREVGEDVTLGWKVVGSIKGWEGDAYVGLGIASPKGKKAVVDVLRDKCFGFATIVSPQAIVSPSAVLGEGCFILKMSCVNHGSVLGDFVTIGCSMIGGDATIGDYTTTTSFVNVTSCKIGSGVFVGSHSVVLSKKRVGDDAFICAGSIVMGNVKAGARVMGYPARTI